MFGTTDERDRPEFAKRWTELTNHLDELTAMSGQLGLSPQEMACSYALRTALLFARDRQAALKA